MVTGGAPARGGHTPALGGNLFAMVCPRYTQVPNPREKGALLHPSLQMLSLTGAPGRVKSDISCIAYLTPKPLMQQHDVPVIAGPKS